MAKLTPEQSSKLETELISIFNTNPSETYHDALDRVHQRDPELKELVTISDLNYRVPKLRRSGKIPPSKRGGRGAATADVAGVAQHPVARAYQELEVAKQGMEDAKRRLEQAEANLSKVLRESLPADFLHKLAQEQQA
jgi:hypothetical protein